MNFNFGLSFKLTFIVFVVSTIIIISVTYVNVEEQINFFEEAYTEKAVVLAQALDASISSTEDLEDSEKLQNYILKFIYTNKEDVKKISINLPDENGELFVFVSTDSGFTNTKSSDYNYQSYSQDKTISYSENIYESHILTVVTPLHIYGQNVGTYEMQLTTEKSYESLYEQIWSSILISMFFLLLLVIISIILLRRVVVKPIIKIRDAANKIGQGNLDVKIKMRSHDEIGELAQSFNQMTKDLKKEKYEVQKYNKMLEEMIVQKEEFIDQLGHDLKNPLTPLVGLLPLIMKEIEDPNIKKHLKIVIINVEYMKNLITKTLQLARLKSTGSEFDFENIVLYEEIQKVIKSQGLDIKNNKIEITNNIDKKIIVKADKMRFRELFDNILSNSIKYMPKTGGEIKINAKKDKNFVTVSIKDTGIGMSKKQIDRAFDEFYKADKSRHELDSSGLGLSICKRIVERHGGKIWAESRGLGRGSIFYFTLKNGEAQNK